MIKITVNTKEFQETIKKLEAITKNNSKYVPILSTIKLNAIGKNVDLIANDLELYARGTLYDNEVHEGGSIILSDVKGLMKSFKHMTEWNTLIEQVDDKIIIKNGNKSIKFTSMDVDSFPCITSHIGECNQYEYNTKDLYERLNLVKHARSKDESRGLLCGVYFNEGDIIATDGYRLACDTNHELNVSKPFTVSSNAVDYLLKTMDKKNKSELIIQTYENNLVFVYDNIELISRVREGYYVNYKQIINIDDHKMMSVNVAELQGNIDFLMVHENKIKMNISKDGLALSTLTSEGTYDANMKAVTNEIELAIGFNGKYMAEALKTVSSELVEILVYNPISPIVIKDGSTTQLVLPIMLSRGKK